MSELSPAAQAVDCAIADRIQLLGEIATSRQIAAAALRAAAEQCQIEWNFHPDYPETEWVVVASDLFAIADELDRTWPSKREKHGCINPG